MCGRRRQDLASLSFWALLGTFGPSVIASEPAHAQFRLLEPLAETRIERIGTFVAARSFGVGTDIGGRTLSTVGLSFNQHFLGVEEEDVPAASLSGWVLQYTAGDRSLIEAVGGRKQAAIPYLAYVHRLMQMAGERRGHTDWPSNFAYVRSPLDRTLWAVHWSVNYAGEWNLGAVQVPHPHLDWRAGSQLFTPLVAAPGSEITEQASREPSAGKQ